MYDKFATTSSWDQTCRRASGRRHYNAVRQFRALLRLREVVDLLGTLGMTRGCQSRVAEQLGVNRSTICRDMARLRRGKRPDSEAEKMARMTARLDRRARDEEFREFYRTVGYGSFKHCGEFCAPQEFIHGAGPAIYFITGSLSPGDGWATEDEHTTLWLSRGRANPNPERFTDEILTLNGVKLYDLLQFGSNGCCCYHQLYVGPDPAPFRYCLLTDSQEMDDRAASFSEGLWRILQFQLRNVY